IFHDLEKLMNGFLWCQGDMKRCKVKVSCNDVCLPKYEGGLGIRKLETFNNALMSSHIWKLINHKESMWVKWIHAYKLKHSSFWDVPLVSNVTYRAVSRAGYNRREKVADVVNEGRCPNVEV
nr:reverse transcriptase domain, reverse transcriptase zinc-binding domain protein [Tanacetum cinerariifolium]